MFDYFDESNMEDLIEIFIDSFTITSCELPLTKISNKNKLV